MIAMANIELPKDAEGREIPLDTKLLYDKEGNPKEVSIFAYTPRSYSSGWSVVLAGGFERFTSAMFLNPPEPPDSWEKLLADLKRGASRVHHPECAYFGRDENDCDQCEAVCSFACKKIAFGDIESRIRKLMGEDK